MAPALVRRWQMLNRAALEAQASASQKGGSLAGTGRILRQFVQIAMLGAGAWLVIDRNASPGIMMAATVLLGRALAPVEGAIAGWKQFVDARNAHERLVALLSGEREVAEPTPLPTPSGAVSVERLVYAVRDAERPILRGVGFQVAAGESLAIIGPSGSGKSTLARLLLGIWPPTAGTVRVDGADLAHWPRDRVGPHLGYLPQNVQLFAGTVAENIARFQEGDPAAVIDAAQRAHVHDLILRLPRGYDTAIGDNGAGLSGGQAQRIALARAVRPSPDRGAGRTQRQSGRRGEEALMRAMQTLKADGATLVLITHRPSLLAGVDRALVLRQGVIELQGTCAEVIGRLARESAPPDTPVVARLGAARAEG
ncbi:MAG: ATP-binding cassette domain-containing protein [Betaproteobacteria bacterium]|nr:ATP-binding cassette domain-containing protein [Betaproteobacteria bacterium]